MDEKAVDRLVETLEQEMKVYEDMLALSKSKTDLVIQGKVAELEKLVKLEQTLLLKISKLEKKREESLAEIAAALGINSSEVNISSLIGALGEDGAGKLKSCQERMLKVLNELKEINGLNSKLIQNSLDYIDFSLNLLAGVDSGLENYGKTGKTEDSKKRSLFDVKL